MCIGIDGDHNIFLKGIRNPSPVHIEAAGMRIQLDNHPIFRAGINQDLDDLRDNLPAQQKATGRMTQYTCIWILNRTQQTAHRFFIDSFLNLNERMRSPGRMWRGSGIAVIHPSVIENITFDAFENMEGCEFCIQLIYVSVLFPDSFFRKSVGIKSRFAVIADHQVFKSLFDAGFGHFLHRMQSVAPVAVAVHDTFDVL